MRVTDLERAERAVTERPVVTGHHTTGQHVAIITGLSGAGKTAASKIFEDLGYTVVDNVPSELLRDLAQLVAGDPEIATRAERLQHGVPIPDDLMVQLRKVADAASVPFVLA